VANGEMFGRMRARTVHGTVIVMAIVLAACSSPPPSSMRVTVPSSGASLKLDDGVSLNVPPGALPPGAVVSLKTVPRAAVAAMGHSIVLSDGATMPSPLGSIGTPIEVDASALLAKPVTLSIHIDQSKLKGQQPFLAWFDAKAGTWMPMVSTYSSSAGTVSAITPHLSIWAPFTWATSAIASTISGAFSAAYKSETTPATANCKSNADDSGLSVLMVDDSIPNGALSVCTNYADNVEAVNLHIVNNRAYPIDVAVPSGGTMTVSGASDIYEQLGNAIQKATSGQASLALLPPSSEGVLTFPVAANQSIKIKTQIDGESFLLSALSLGLSEYGAIIAPEAAAQGVSGNQVTANLLTELDGGTCVANAHNIAAALGAGPISIANAKKLVGLAFDCIDAAAGKSVLPVFAVLARIFVGLGTALVQATWATVDSAMNSSSHILTVSKGAAPPSPAASPTSTPTTGTPAPPTTQPMLIALSGDTPVYEPSSIGYTGDGTGELSGVTWSSWGPSGASGTGTDQINDCVPECYDGTITNYQATVSLSNASQTQEGYIFTELTIDDMGAPQPSNSYSLPR
jgi:hypothetical protein